MQGVTSRELVEAGANELFEAVVKESRGKIFAGMSNDEIEAARNLTIPLLLGPNDHPGSLRTASQWMNHLATPHLQEVPRDLRPLLAISDDDVIRNGEEAGPLLERFLLMRLGALRLQTLPKERHNVIAAASSFLFIKSCAALGLVEEEK